MSDEVDRDDVNPSVSGPPPGSESTEELQGSTPGFVNTEALAAELAAELGSANLVNTEALAAELGSANRDALTDATAQPVSPEVDRILLAQATTRIEVLTARIETLTAALAARDLFISAVGHELRNAVAPILLLTEQLTEITKGAGDTRLPTRIEKLAKHSHKVVMTIEQVAEVVQLRNEQIAIDVEHLDMAAEVRHMAARASEQARARGVTFEIDAPEPIYGLWDRSRLRQIVAHLLSNAIRYGGSEPIEIAVRRRAHGAELVVRDHGPGVPVSDLATIFDRLEYPFQRSGGGLGVGLFVVRALCRAMDGDVTAENAPDGGASFTVFLPRT